MRWTLLLTLAIGCAAYDPARPCLDLSPDTYCDSAFVQATKPIGPALGATAPPALPPAPAAAAPWPSSSRCDVVCRPDGVDGVACHQVCR
jgi:hypothetical protein